MSQLTAGCRKYWYEYFVTLTVNIMTMTAAIGLVWTNPILPRLKSGDPTPLPRNIDHLEESQIASFLSIGIFMSTTTSGIMADRIGRKGTLILYTVPMLISDVLFMIGNTIPQFCVARLFVGIGVGCVWTVTPMYTAEIATLENRGFISVLLVVLTTGAQLFLYIYVRFTNIRGIAIVTFAMSVTFLILTILFVPESPYYYAVSKKFDKTEKVLITLRRKDDVKEELAEIMKSVDSAKVKKSHDESWTQIFKSKVVFKSLLIVMGLLFYQQNTGTVPFSLFLETIFAASGSKIPADTSVIIVTSVQLVVLLSVSKVIDAIRRKVLLIISMIGVIISVFCLGLYFFFKERGDDMQSVFWLPITSLISYQLFANIGIGPLTFVIAGEIFPTNHLRTYLNGIAFSFFIILGYGFSHYPTFEHYFGNANMAFYFTAVSCTCIPFIIYCIPETKGKTFHEIQLMLEEGRTS